MVVTVTLNAAIDKTYTVEGFSLDRVHRPSVAKSVAGGKGINVARVLRELGQDVLATGFAGGTNGNQILRGLDDEGLPHDFVRTEGESRLCIAVIDPEKGTQTEVNENGPEVSEAEVQALRGKLEALVPKAEYLVLSGSAPPGVPSDFYAEAIALAKSHGVKAVLDTSGNPLSRGVAAGPYMLKPNARELSSLKGRELLTVEEILGAAKSLLASKIEIVVVSMGRSGAIATDGRESWQAAPPEIEFVSAVGSGDALVAAFLDALIRGRGMREALRWGTAAGAANAATYGAGFCKEEEISRLADEVRLSPMD